MWSRCVNTHGLPGRNVSCDLHMEHLTRVAKMAIRGLGANKTPKSVIRVGKSIRVLKQALDMFDEQNSVASVSGAHTSRSSQSSQVLSQRNYNLFLLCSQI